MEPRKVFHTTEYRLPKSSFTLIGYSRASYRSGFYINGLGIALDGGPQFFKRVNHYFITHGHSDHTANLPYSLIDDVAIDTDGNAHMEKPIVYCPTQTAPFLDDKILSSFRSNYATNKADKKIRSYYEVRGIDGGTELDLVVNKQKLKVRTYDSDHSVPTIVYGISLIKKKLKPEFADLDKSELGQLARSGTQLSGEVEEPFISYVLDSSIHTLENYPEVLDYPTVIIECTFLFDGEEESAERKKHIHWNDLLPYIQDRPDTTFILTHFSLRYTDPEIQDFFREHMVKHDVQNVYPWLTDIQFSLEDHNENEDILEDYEDSIMPSYSNPLYDAFKFVSFYVLVLLGFLASYLWLKW
jgi:ribonuclease Z